MFFNIIKYVLLLLNGAYIGWILTPPLVVIFFYVYFSSDNNFHHHSPPLNLILSRGEILLFFCCSSLQASNVCRFIEQNGKALANEINFNKLLLWRHRSEQIFFPLHFVLLLLTVFSVVCANEWEREARRTNILRQSEAWKSVYVHMMRAAERKYLPRIFGVSWKSKRFSSLLSFCSTLSNEKRFFMCWESLRTWERVEVKREKALKASSLSSRVFSIGISYDDWTLKFEVP